MNILLLMHVEPCFASLWPLVVLLTAAVVCALDTSARVRLPYEEERRSGCGVDESVEVREIESMYVID